MKLFYDLHMHTCLSPCGEEEMTPANVVGMAELLGLHMLAISDHNAIGNCKTALEIAKNHNILVICGMELTTREEVHVVCLFPSLETASEFGKYVYDKLPDIKNRPDIFGRQLFVDEEDEISAEEPKLLITAADIGIYEVMDLVRKFGGTAFPAHIDRNSFSLLNNLGVYDPAMGFPCVEISADCDEKALLLAHPELLGVPYLRNSDAHSLVGMREPENAIELPRPDAPTLIDTLEAGRLLNIFHSGG